MVPVDAPSARGIGRRTYLRASAAAVVGAGTLAGCLGSGSEADTGDWPTFAADAGNTGATDARGPDDATERWSLETNPIYHAPAVADGVVYVGDFVSRNDEDAEESPTLAAYDAETGDREWSYAVEEYPIGTPTVADDAVFVTGVLGAQRDVDERETRVYAVGTDESERWSTDLDGAGHGGTTAVDGVVYVTTRDGTYGLDAESGDLEWTVEHEEGELPQGTPAIVEDTAYVALGTGATAYDLDTGERRWQFDPEFSGTATIHSTVVADGVVYFGSLGEDRIVAVDAADGETRWSEGTGLPTQPPVVTDETVYVGMDTNDPGDYTSRVLALDAETGAERWRFEPEESGATAAVADGTVYVRTLASAYALDPDDGEPQWEYTSGFGAPWDEDGHMDDPAIDSYAVTSAPAIADGALFAGSPSGGLYAVGEP